MIGQMRTQLRRTPRHPEIVRSFFHADEVAYAAT
jgi:hypothetical protein